MVFCSVPCWDAHVPIMNHRDAWSEERQAPSLTKFKQEQAEEQTPKVPVSSPARSSGGSSVSDTPKDVLVVVSKLKAYIKAKGGCNTSADVNDRLSDIIRRLCDEAINHARQDGRKTVMARDF